MLVIPARVKVVAVMVSALALAAGLLTLALLAKPAQAQLQNKTISLWFPITFTAEHPCTGEPLQWEVMSHVVFHEDDIHLLFHGNVKGQAVSPSGAVYLTNSAGQTTNNVQGNAEDFTFTQHFNVIGPGRDTPEDDYHASTVEHVTQNANGEYTAEVIKIEAECK